MGLEYIDVSWDDGDENSRAGKADGHRPKPGNRASSPGGQRLIWPENQVITKNNRQRTANVKGQKPSRGEGPEIIGAVRQRRPSPAEDKAVRAQRQSAGRKEGRPLRMQGAGREERRPLRAQGAGQAKRRRARAEGQRTAKPRTQEYRDVRRASMPAAREVQRTRALRRRRRQQKIIAARMTAALFCVIIVGLSGLLLFKALSKQEKEVEKKKIEDVFNPNVERKEVVKANETAKPAISEKFLTVNEYSRPGEPLEKINNIFVHYTANPGTSAAQNRSYFENLGTTGETSASAHFVIGYDGEIVQCIPLDEIAYAVMGRNYDSISIECCYLSKDGKFEDATYQSLIQLSAWLLKEYKLAPEDMRRHYDEGGKKCPLYYVEHEEAWWQFLSDLEEYIMNTQV